MGVGNNKAKKKGKSARVHCLTLRVAEGGEWKTLAASKKKPDVSIKNENTHESWERGRLLLLLLLQVESSLEWATSFTALLGPFSADRRRGATLLKREKSEKMCA